MADASEDENKLFQLADLARYEFEGFIGEVDGVKDLIIQRDLLSVLEHVTPIKYLKQIKIDRIFWLDNPGTEGNLNRFFLMKPTMQSVYQMVSFVKEDMKSGTPRNNYVIFIPRMLYTCEEVMEQNGIYGKVKIFEWSLLQLIPLDVDFMSLEEDATFRSLYVEQDYSMLHTVASSLLNFQQTFGSFSVVHAGGALAMETCQLMNNIKEKNFETPPNPLVTEVVLFDRSLDFVTPLCTQLTYEGVLDDCFTIKSAFVQLDPTVTDRSKSVKVLVNSSDPVFRVIRGLHIPAANSTLSQITRELDAKYKEGKDRKQTIDQMKDFVKLMPELKQKHQSLSSHIKACEKIFSQKSIGEFQKQLEIERALIECYEGKEVIDFIEECINRQITNTVPLKLMCMASCTVGGMKSKQLQSLKHLFMQSYGHKHLVTFFNLQKCGLLVESGKSAGNFKVMSRKYGLVPKGKQASEAKPNEVAYVFGGVYKPLSCTIIEAILAKKDWKLMEGLKGVTYNQPVSVRPPSEVKASKRNVLVYFIGGCSFSEIQALRILGQKIGVNFIVATTNTINGHTMLDGLLSS